MSLSLYSLFYRINSLSAINLVYKRDVIVVLLSIHLEAKQTAKRVIKTAETERKEGMALFCFIKREKSRSELFLAPFPRRKGKREK